MSAPLCPVVGVPIFIMAAPRLRKTWEGGQQSEYDDDNTSLAGGHPATNGTNESSGMPMGDPTLKTDAAYYKQLFPQLLGQGTEPGTVSASMYNLLAGGSLGTPYPGAVYLLRQDKFLVWMQVLEVSQCSYSVELKGLELQETSCHNLEARVAVEEGLEAALLTLEEEVLVTDANAGQKRQ